MVSHPFRFGWMLAGVFLGACSGLQTKPEAPQESKAQPTQTMVSVTPEPAVVVPIREPPKTENSQTKQAGASSFTASQAQPSSQVSLPGGRPEQMFQQKTYSGTGNFIKKPRPGGEEKTPAAEQEVTLNFENTDIREVARVILGDLLGVSYILDPKVNGAVTLYTGRPLPQNALLSTLETLLRMNGAAVVRVDGVYQVVPLANAVKGLVTPQLGEYSNALPQGYSVQIVPLRYISANEMNTILTPLAPEGSVIRIDTVRNLLILAATRPELSKLLDTIQMFDVDWMRGISVGFFPLKYANVEDVMRGYETIFGEAEGSFSGMFKVIPIPSANSLLVVTQRPEYLDKAREWITQVDQLGAAGGALPRLFVYKVRNVDAVALSEVIGSLFEGKGGGSGTKQATVAPGETSAQLKSTTDTGKGSRTSSLSKSSSLSSSSSSSSSKTSSSTSKVGGAVAGKGRSGGTHAFGQGAEVFEAGLRVVADATNNSLLILATPRDYAIILEALEKLDVVPMQVVIEATIVEVSLTGKFKFGLQWFFESSHGGDRTSLFTLTGDKSIINGDGALSTGFQWTLLNSADKVRAVLNALADNSMVNVLSSPSVMVLDNQSARIQVGDEVPIVTQQQQSTITSGTNNSILNSIQYRDTGVVLQVTPRVNPGGLVIMDVDQEVSNISTQKVEGIDSPIIRTRNIKSSVAVQAGQVVVLGGLIRDEKANTKSGLPWLSNIPVMGWAFGQTGEDTTRNELVVVLRPRVIAHADDARDVLQEFRNRLKGLQWELLSEHMGKAATNQVPINSMAK